MDIGAPFIVSYTLFGFFVLSILVLAFCSKDYYFIYDHRLLFVIGLVFSRSLTYHAVTNVIMWYVTYNIEDGFVRSAVLSNIQDCLSSLFVIFMAHSADSFVGRFRTLVFSNTAYISGVLILWIFNPYDVTWLIVVAMVLLALGKSGDAILKHVLIDLVDGIDMSTDRTKKRSLTRGAIWWSIAHAFGAIASILWVAPDAFGGVQPTWRTTFLICFISMIAALVIFCTGHNVYHQRELTQRPVEIFFRVFLAKLKKLLKSNSRCSMNSSEHERLPENRRQENEGVALDRSPSHLDTNRKKYRGNSSYNDDIKAVRSLLRMFPMWGTLIVVSLVSAAGRTFYIEQFSNLKGNREIPAQMFDVIQDISGFAILIMYSWTRFSQNEKLKIGVGMFCSIISCVCAWRLEVCRLKAVLEQGDDDDDTSISFLWLVPQFSILGCMEWLAEEGSLNFFKSQIDEPIKSFREEYMEVVVSLGLLINTFLISILKSQRWFGYDVNNGTRLDKYYRLLVYLCSVNFIIYYCIAKCFYKETEQERHSAHGNLQLSESTDHATTGNSYRRKRFLVLLSRQVSFVFDTLF